MPQFSPDGSQIAFSVHTNGEVNEDIFIADLTKKSVTQVVHDNGLKRYPAWDPQGNLYYVSDKTGVDNLYRYPNRQVSNFETGLAFPSFSLTSHQVSTWRPCSRRTDGTSPKQSSRSTPFTQRNFLSNHLRLLPMTKNPLITPKKRLIR